MNGMCMEAQASSFGLKRGYAKAFTTELSARVGQERHVVFTRVWLVEGEGARACASQALPSFCANLPSQLALLSCRAQFNCM